MAVLFLLAAAVCAVSVESVFAQVMCMIAAIWAGFAAVYGIGWLVYARREAKRQKKIERAAELLREESSNQLAYAEFTLPKDELAAGAKKRFTKFAAALLCIALTVFAVLYVIILLSAGWGGFVHLLWVLGFCLLITVPGTLVQYGIYKKYVSDLPEKIILFPGKLIIDGRQFAAREVQSIGISS